MLRFRSHSTALVLLAIFAAETLLLGVAHRHCPPLAAGLELGAHDCLEDCDPAASSSKAALESPAPAHPAPRRTPAHHDDSHCLVCQFLAKQALPVSLSAAPSLAAPLRFVEHSAPVRDPASQISLPLSRGPPA